MASCISSYSYIKPQLMPSLDVMALSCISSYSYIKPQREYQILYQAESCISSYSYIKPQLPVHVPVPDACCISSYSYIKPQLVEKQKHQHYVVYLLIPTSNRNYCPLLPLLHSLYIFLFLHQTATSRKCEILIISCISSYSYIKPQPSHFFVDCGHVVYLLIPTSNRNSTATSMCICLLYIFLFLHQTATFAPSIMTQYRCISSYSYIKPQLCWFC